MENDYSLIRTKLKGHFSEIFEKALLNEIIKIGIYKRIEKDQMLVDIGDEMTHIPLIIKGVVKIIREDDQNDEILLYSLHEGDTCAISFINCNHRDKSVFRGVVEKTTECIMIPVTKIEEWLVKYKTWRVFIIDSYHSRLLEMVETIEDVAFMSLDDRLHKYLVEEVKLLQNRTLIMTHQEIADDLNTSRVVISRMLKKLEKKGKLRLGRNRILVTDL